MVNKYKRKPGNPKPKPPKKNHPWKTGMIILIKLRGK